MNPRLLQIVVLMMLPATATWSQAPAQSPSLTRAIEQFHTAFAGSDHVSLKPMLADDAVLVSAGGHSLSPDEILKDVQSIKQDRPDMVMNLAAESIEIGPDAWNIASEAGTWRESWTEAGSEVELHGRYHAIWRREGESWRLVALLLVPISCSGPYCTSES